MKLKLASALLLICVLLSGCLRSSDRLVEHPQAEALLEEYLSAFQARDLTRFRDNIVSPNYAHQRRDGTVEDREGYLQNLQQIFKFSVRDVQVLAVQSAVGPDMLKIDLHWTMKIGYSFIKEVTVIDKTKFTYLREGQYWKLVEDAPVLKDGRILHHGMTLTSTNKMEFLESISIQTSRVYLRMGIRFPAEFLNLTHKIVTKWYAPDGTLFFESFDLKTPTGNDYFYWSPMDVRGNVQPTHLGEWRVEAYLNDLYKFEHTFIMTQ